MQIVLIDDHHLFRAGLATVLRERMPAVRSTSRLQMMLVVQRLA